MLEEIRKKLLAEPEKIEQLLELYGFAHIKIRKGYISCARDEDSSPKSIVIRIDGQYLYFNDYPRNVNAEFIKYLIDYRGATYKQVMKDIRGVLGISDYESYFHRASLFGGFYDTIKTQKVCSTRLKTYDESVLDKYVKAPNIKFYKDHISLDTQVKFGLRFSEQDNGIIIPIYNETADLIGAKVRCNYESDSPDWQKYWYAIPCRMSNTLYGFSHNYQSMYGGTVLIFESEKSVMQCASYGIDNAVALGSGTLSTKQAQMINSLYPEKVIFMHDNNYDVEAIDKNMEVLRSYNRFASFDIGWWDWRNKKYPKKCSPSDLGKNTLEHILEEEIEYEL